MICIGYKYIHKLKLIHYFILILYFNNCIHFIYGYFICSEHKFTYPDDEYINTPPINFALTLDTGTYMSYIIFPYGLAGMAGGRFFSNIKGSNVKFLQPIMLKTGLSCLGFKTQMLSG